MKTEELLAKQRIKIEIEEDGEFLMNTQANTLISNNLRKYMLKSPAFDKMKDKFESWSQERLQSLSRLR